MHPLAAMIHRLIVLTCLILAGLVYVNYRTSDVREGHDADYPIETSSQVLLAPVDDYRIAIRPSAARRGLLSLRARDRTRCWALLKIIVDVFRYAPEQRDSLERVVRAYAVKRDPPSGRGPCTLPKPQR